MRAGIDIPDPTYAFATGSGCRAVVRTGSGAAYVVDGAKGTAFELDLGDHADVMDPEPWTGGDRWGVFSSPDASLGVHPIHFPAERRPDRNQQPWPRNRFALVDFATGAVTDLRDISSAMFSPDGEALAVATRPEPGGVHTMWLISSREPRQRRALALSDGFEGLVEFDGERVLYRDRADDWDRLMVASEPTGAQSTVAQKRSQFDPSVPLLDGWLLHGRPEVAVHLPDRFAVFDTSDGTPRELFSVEGMFVTVYLPPNGKGAVLWPARDNADQTARFVNLEQGTSRRLVGEAGAPLVILHEGADDRLLVVLSSGRWSSGAILDVGTGKVSPLPAGNAWSGVSNEDLRYLLESPWSNDQLTLMYDFTGEGNTRCCTVLDLKRGTVTELDSRCPDSLDISPNGRWAAYSKRIMVDSAERPLQWILTVIETATGKTIFTGPGKNPVWLAP